VITAMADAFGAPRPWAVPGWLMRLAAPYLASFAVDASMRVSSEKAIRELGWRPAFATYRDGVAAMASAARPAGREVAARS
jgi:nucleoside-diphosphate-sugar epimerase